MTDPTKDIDALLAWLKVTASINSESPRYHAALTALIADRDALKQRVEQLEMYQRVGRGSAADRDRELRERLVCAALTRLCADPRYDFPEEAAIAIADRALAAMRKGVRDGK